MISAFAAGTLVSGTAHAESCAPPVQVIGPAPVAPVFGPPPVLQPFFVQPVIPACSSFSVNATPDVTATDPASPGNLYVGSGIPATNFGLARNLSQGVELGLQVIYRQGPTVTSSDNYDDGVLNFNVASGPQSTANGSSVNNTSRAAWSFNFSVATGLNGSPSNLGNRRFQLLYDVDPGPGTNFRILVLEPKGGSPVSGLSGYQWRDQGTGQVFISDDEGTPNVTQNSENYAFSFFQSFLTSAYGPGNNFAGPAKFDIYLLGFNGNEAIATNHIAINVAAGTSGS